MNKLCDLVDCPEFCEADIRVGCRWDGQCVTSQSACAGLGDIACGTALGCIWEMQNVPCEPVMPNAAMCIGFATESLCNVPGCSWTPAPPETCEKPSPPSASTCTNAIDGAGETLVEQANACICAGCCFGLGCTLNGAVAIADDLGSSMSSPESFAGFLCEGLPDLSFQIPTLDNLKCEPPQLDANGLITNSMDGAMGALDGALDAGKGLFDEMKGAFSGDSCKADEPDCYCDGEMPFTNRDVFEEAVGRIEDEEVKLEVQEALRCRSKSCMKDAWETIFALDCAWTKPTAELQYNEEL